MSGNFEFLVPTFLPILAGAAIATCKKLNRTLFLRVLVFSILIISSAFVFYINFSGQEMSLMVHEFTADISINFAVDDASSFFSTITTVLWVLVLFYSFEYVKHEKREQQFFGFYLMTFGAIIALDYAANLVSFYLFFEIMTLASLPLVIHSRTKEAISAGLKYLIYSLCGAFMSLLGIIFITFYSRSTSFVGGGVFNNIEVQINKDLLLVAVFITILGFAVKAGMFPFHGWLPTAHPVAPAPASALLSGLITKAGVLGVVRVIYYICGDIYLIDTWVQYTLLILSIITIVMGSMMAYREKQLKKRLAYSTVSQVSYVLFGIFLLTLDGYRGAMTHIYFHAIMKVGLFLIAGAIIYKTGKTNVCDLKNMGHKMPITMICFAVCSLGLVGIPPTSGFISKWFLAIGSLYSNINIISWVGAIALLLSAILTAGYLLVPVFSAFFEERKTNRLRREELSYNMIIPIIILAALTVFLGVANGGIVGTVDEMIVNIF